MEKNLDRICEEYGYKLAQKIQDEALLTKSLGVLQEQGLYSFVLYCESIKNKENKSQNIIKITKEILKDKLKLIDNGDLLEEIRKENGLASRLDDLIFAIQILEKSLIYARYHAKALSKSSTQNANSGENSA
ncbi:hypothetical protein [Methanocella conradii]|uniref:hypothetical protein n=1 Tax=Methanocella conradii TaxID=1175444 RepID=UPI0024B37642|nr:hypothetical protein [Methanocella conradii]MDI6895772.1 hypothetical protein [Methanocella conradii]